MPGYDAEGFEACRHADRGFGLRVNMAVGSIPGLIILARSLMDDEQAIRSGWSLGGDYNAAHRAKAHWQLSQHERVVDTLVDLGHVSKVVFSKASEVCQ